jgi:hypothetical protein
MLSHEANDIFGEAREQGVLQAPGDAGIQVRREFLGYPDAQARGVFGCGQGVLLLFEVVIL